MAARHSAEADEGSRIRLDTSLKSATLARAGRTRDHSDVADAIASAHPGSDCWSQNAYHKSNVEATQDTQRGNHQGVKSASMWVGAAANDCSRESTLGVFTATGGGFVEWGWNLGWLWDSICPTTSYQPSPTRFVAWAPRNGRPTVDWKDLSPKASIEVSPSKIQTPTRSGPTTTRERNWARST